MTRPVRKGAIRIPSEMSTAEKQQKARILDGNEVSGAIIACVRESVEKHVAAGGGRPGLAG